MANRSRQEKKHGSKPKQKTNLSDKAKQEAADIAESVSKPGFTKQQKKEVRLAIEQGIARYKAQYKSKVRDLDKQRKKQQKSQADEAPMLEPEVVGTNNKWAVILPWTLLVISWALGAAFFLLNQ